MKIQTQILLLLSLISLSEVTQCQKADSVSFVVTQPKDTLISGQTPFFKFHLANNLSHAIKVPTQLMPFSNPSANVNIEIFYSGSEPEKYKNGCNMDSEFKVDEKGKTSSRFSPLNPGDMLSFSTTVSCYSFERIGKYRIRFTLDYKKTGLIGTTDWLSFVVIK